MPDRIAEEIVFALREARSFLEDQVRLGVTEFDRGEHPEAPETGGGEAPAMQKAPSLSDVKRAVQDCDECPMGSQGKRIVGTGPEGAALVVAVPAPDAEDLENGGILAGETGQLFNAILFACGLTREQVYVTSLIKCVLPDRSVESREISACLAHFGQELAFSPKAPVILMGHTGADWLWPTGHPESEKGGWRQWEGRAFQVTHHPAELLQDPALKPQVWEVLREIQSLQDR